MPGTEGHQDVSKPELSELKLTGLQAISILPKILELTLNNGFDKSTNKRVGTSDRVCSDYKSFDDLMEAFKIQVNYFADIKIRGNNVIMKTFAEWLPVPFLSLLVEDCIS